MCHVLCRVHYDIIKYDRYISQLNLNETNFLTSEELHNFVFFFFFAQIKAIKNYFFVTNRSLTLFLASV